MAPVPPPSDGKRTTISSKIDAITQVAIAKYPVRSRDTSHHTGSPTTAQPATATGSPRNGSTAWLDRISTMYPPSPTNACWPTDTSPA